METIHQLLDQVSLADIRTIECQGALKISPDEGAGLRTLANSDNDTQLSIALNPVLWGELIEVWVRGQVENDRYTASTAVAVVYRRQEDEEIPNDIRIEFIEKIIVMTAYPYLRSGLQNLATTLGVGEAPLPILPQGAFHMSGTDDEDTVASDTPPAP